MICGWENLPEHLLDSVLEKIEYLPEFWSLGSVCSEWHSVTRDHRKKLLGLSNHRVPMLLVPLESEHNDEWGIYSVFTNSFIKPRLWLPSYNVPFCGTSHGWVGTIDENYSVMFHKPFAESIERVMIRLPPLFPDPDPDTGISPRWYVPKLAVDLIKNPDDIVVVVIFGEVCELAYIRPAKDSTWTRVLGPIHKAFDDVIYYDDRFYALSTLGKLVKFNGMDSEVVVADELPCDGTLDEYCHKRYLVESCRGELLQFMRYSDLVEGEQRSTTRFRIFKLSCNDAPKWDEIERLDDDCVVFLGDNTSVCGLASEFVGCHRNSIYFTHGKDDNYLGDRGPWDMGFYSMETGRVQHGFTIDAAAISKMQGTTPRSPIWIIPTFNC